MSLVQATNIINFNTTCNSMASGDDWGVNCISSTEQSAAWNYGANFGGPSKTTWTSGANSITMGTSDSHSADGGMFGKYAVADGAYDYNAGGIEEYSWEIPMCGGGRGSSSATSSNYKYGPKYCKG
jgi:hypothetical protein